MSRWKKKKQKTHIVIRTFFFLNFGISEFFPDISPVVSLDRLDSQLEINLFFNTKGTNAKVPPDWPAFRPRPLADTLRHATTRSLHEGRVAAPASRLADPLESRNLLASGETFISRSAAEWRGESCVRTK